MAKKLKSEDIDFTPLRDGVVLKAARRDRAIILLDGDGKERNEDNILYEYLEVYKVGPLVKDLKIGDRVKVSASIVAQPEFLWCNYTEDEILTKKDKVDYLLVGYGFIKGIWHFNGEKDKENSGTN